MKNSLIVPFPGQIISSYVLVQRGRGWGAKNGYYRQKEYTCGQESHYVMFNSVTYEMYCYALQSYLSFKISRCSKCNIIHIDTFLLFSLFSLERIL